MSIHQSQKLWEFSFTSWMVMIHDDLTENRWWWSDFLVSHVQSTKLTFSSSWKPNAKKWNKNSGVFYVNCIFKTLRLFLLCKNYQKHILWCYLPWLKIPKKHTRKYIISGIVLEEEENTEKYILSVCVLI